MEEAEHLLSLRQLKELTGLSMASIMRLRKRGSGPRELRLGKRRVVVPLSAYQEWIKNNVIQPCMEEKNVIE